MDANKRRQRASLEAAEWKALLQSADLPRTEREQFVQWIRESSLHVEEFTRACQVEVALTHFERWAAISGDTTSDDSNVVSIASHARAHVISDGAVKRRIPRARLGLLAAAVAAVAILVTGFLPFYGNQNIVTERADRREVALSDGSVVTLDPESQIRVEFRPNSRRVLLQKGRALFRVAKNANRPFFVASGNTMVRAVGTQFGVERGTQDTIVTVAEGKVGIVAGHVAANEIVLVANEQVVVASAQVGPPAIRKVDSERELAWAKGLLVFDNDTVTRVIERFNRYNRIQMHVTDAKLASRPVSGTFDASDPESFVAFVKRASQTRVVRVGDQDVTFAAPQ